MSQEGQSIITSGTLIRILHQLHMPLVYLGKNDYGYEIWQDALDSLTEYWVLSKCTPVQWKEHNTSKTIANPILTGDSVLGPETS